MSEPAMFVLIRDGKKSFYADRWAAVFLYREILWGPDDFETWVTQLDPLDEWSDDFSSGVVVDFDRRTLVWSGDGDKLEIPKVGQVYDRLLQAAWPNYDVQRTADGLPNLAEAAVIEHPDEDDSEFHSRPHSIREAAGLSDEPSDSNEDEETDFGDSSRAWITLIDQGGAVRHRQLMHLPCALLEAEEEVIEQLAQLEAAEIPPESQVVEGMWIDQPRRTIGLWGGPSTRQAVEIVQKAWPGWKVRWSDRGYAEHCQVSGPGGIPMSENEALAQFLPIVLSTKRFDLNNMIGAIGGSLKRTAMKATGCLLLLMCSPVLLFGLISGNWKAALITVAIVCAIVIVAFKAIEFRFRSSMAEKTKPLRQRGADDQNRAMVAGPLDEQQRRQRLDQLLMAAGFPPLKSIEPSFPKENELDLLEG